MCKAAPVSLWCSQNLVCHAYSHTPTSTMIMDHASACIVSVLTIRCHLRRNDTAECATQMEKGLTSCAMHYPCMGGKLRISFNSYCAVMQIVAPYAHWDIPVIGQAYILFRARLAPPYTFWPGTESLETRLFAPEDIPFDQVIRCSSSSGPLEYGCAILWPCPSLKEWEKRLAYAIGLWFLSMPGIMHAVCSFWAVLLLHARFLRVFLSPQQSA